MNFQALFLIVISLFLNVASASAQRVTKPVKDNTGSQPGKSGKVTRVDFEKKQIEDNERKQRIDALDLEEKEADDEITKQAKRQEKEALEEVSKKLEEERKKAMEKNPEDFAKDGTQVPMNGGSKESSTHETVVTQAALVEKAQKVVVRRAR